MKEALGTLKQRKPRLPVPSASEVAPPPAGSPQAVFGSVTNGRARKFYLPDAWFANEVSLGSNDTKQLVDYKLKTQCFWVVSRGNNCHYCLGHQEHKLKMEGLTDDQVASLDFDWESLDARTKKAVTLARKMTLEPYSMNEKDIQNLQPEFNDNQIVELVSTIARFNSTNRWTDSLGLPQDDVMRNEKVEFNTPTASRWEKSVSVAKPDMEMKRPMLAGIEEIRKHIAESKTRKPFVQLADESKARTVLGLSTDAVVNDWMRALATLATATPSNVSNFETMMSDTELDPQLKAQILWTTARNNRAWTSLAMADERLRRLGWKDDAFEKLASSSNSEDSAGAAIRFATKLTNQPFQMTDADIVSLQKHFTDRQTAHIVHLVCTGNALDRLTEALNLSSK